jgi:hypothetical protein
MGQPTYNEGSRRRTRGSPVRYSVRRLPNQRQRAKRAGRLLRASAFSAFQMLSGQFLESSYAKKGLLIADNFDISCQKTVRRD